MDVNMMKMVNYIKGLEFLHRQSPSVVRGLLTLYNHQRHAIEEKARRITYYQDLAEPMLIASGYALVIDLAKQLMDEDPATLNEFLKLIGAEAETVVMPPPPPALVKEFMEAIPPGTVYRPKDTLAEAIHVFANMPQGGRYLLVIDENKTLKGMISVNDFDNNIDKIKAMKKNTYLIDLDFLRKDPKTLSGDAPMDEARALFKKSADEKRKITKILVVDNEERPIGYLSEEGISKWAATSMEE